MTIIEYPIWLAHTWWDHETIFDAMSKRDKKHSSVILEHPKTVATYTAKNGAPSQD